MKNTNLNPKPILLFFVLILFSTSCIEEYWPEIETNSEQLLVVDGKITNFPGPYTIKLSTSGSSFNTPVLHPKRNATVIIMDNQGRSEVLTEVEPGTYQTRDGGLQGIVGNSYKIRIEIDNSKVYESAFEEMLEPVAIESLSVEESISYSEDESKIDQEGFQFYVDSEKAQTANTYLYWEIEETYEYHANHKISFYYDGRFFEKTMNNPYGLSIMRNIDSLYNCWMTQHIHERYTYSTEFLSIPKVNHLPLHFIPFSDRRLETRYSILVTQYSISNKAYLFYDKIKKQNENNDALYTTQPFQINGNIENINDTNEAVLGYFMVASGSVGPRLMTKAPSRIQYYRQSCQGITDYNTIMDLIRLTPAENLPLFFTMVAIPDETGGEAPAAAMAYVYRECIDCQEKGGTLKKPEYWDWEELALQK